MEMLKNMLLILLTAQVTKFTYGK